MSRVSLRSDLRPTFLVRFILTIFISRDTTIGAYPWVEGIALMTVFSLFFAELMTIRYAKFEVPDHEILDSDRKPSALPTNLGTARGGSLSRPTGSMSMPGEDHFGHTKEHQDNMQIGEDWEKHGLLPENYSAQLTGIFILEFGVIFHSIFIGLTLAVAGEEFVTLYIGLCLPLTDEDHANVSESLFSTKRSKAWGSDPDWRQFHGQSKLSQGYDGL